MAAGAVRLAYAPVSLPWIAAEAERRMQAMLGPDARVAIGGGALAWGGGSDFSIGLTDVSVVTPVDISGTLRHVELGIDVTPFAEHAIAVNDIRIVEPDVTIPWPPPLPQPRSPWPVPVGPLDGANRIIDSVVARHGSLLFENLSITGGTVRQMTDGGAGVPWLTDVAGLAGQQDDGDVISLVLTGQTSRGNIFDAALERVPAEAPDGGHVLSLSVKGFEIPSSRSAAADPSGELGWVPADLSAVGDFTADYGIRQAVFAAEIGPGTVAIGPKDSGYLKHADIELAWSQADRALRFAKGRIELGDSVVELTGSLAPTAKNPLEPWLFDIVVHDARIDPTDVAGPPVVLEEVAVTGSILPPERTIRIDRASVNSTRAPIEAVGSLTFLDKGMLISGALNIGRVNADAVKTLWPSFVVGGTRRWILDNIRGGVVDHARIDVALGPTLTDGDPDTLEGADDAVALDLTFSGVTLKSFGEMSEIENANGRAVIDGRRFEVTVDGAEFRSPAGQPVPASEGRFVIPDIFARQRAGEVSFKVAGKNDIVGAIANQDPVKALDRLGVAPDALSGEVTAKVDAVFPLRKRIQIDDVEWVVDADFDKLSSSAPIDGRSIEDANINVVVDPKMLTMAGIATLDGVRANIRVTESLSDPSAAMSGDLTLVLSEKDRLARGIDLGGALHGPVAVGISVLPDGNREVGVDLTKAKVTIPVFGWTKAVGIAGQATFLLRREGNRQILDDFRLRAGEAAIEGRIVINGAGEIESADVSRFAVRKGDDATLHARLVGKKRYAIEFEAENFDGRGLIKTIKSQQASESGGTFGDQDFVVTAKARNLIGFKGEVLRNVAGKLTLAGNSIQALEVDAGIGKRGKAEARIQRESGVSSMLVTTSDSGSLLRFLDLYGGVANGEGFLQATTERDGVTSGHVTITDLTVATTKEFSNRFAETSRNLNLRDDGPLPPASGKQGSRLPFEKFRAEFVKQGSTLKVPEAYIRSPLIGGTFAGDIDLSAGRMAMTGTMIPVYGLNNLFGQIPVLGALMGAGRHGGLVGVTFRIGGSLEDPDLLINPASALAPGIFRKIFEFK